MKRGRLKSAILLTLITNLHAKRHNSLPNFYEDPRSQTVEDMSSVALTCRANGIPKPKITWQKRNSKTGNWQVLDNKYVDGTAMVFEGDLDFIAVSKGGRRGEYSDDGEYRCLAKNIMGEVESQPARLTVACK